MAYEENGAGVSTRIVQRVRGGGAGSPVGRDLYEHRPGLDVEQADVPAVKARHYLGLSISVSSFECTRRYCES